MIDRLINYLFIFLLLAWIYALVGAFVQSVMSSLTGLIVTYYRAKGEWLNTLARNTVTKTTEEKL